MINRFNSIPGFKTAHYEAIKEIHNELDEALENPETSQEEITKIYLKEMEQAMLLGSFGGKDYNLYQPY